MFFFTKLKDEIDDTGQSASRGRNRPPLRRSETFSRADVFRTWAKDSFLNESTIDLLVQTHQIDCLPAVLALRVEDIADLGLAVGQQRLLEDAVRKLHEEYELVRPPTPKTKISLDLANYKNLIDAGNPLDSGRTACAAQTTYGRTKSGTEAGEYSLTGPYDAAHTALQGRKNSPTGDAADQWGPSGRLIGEEAGEDNCLCACQRWLLVAIAMPLIFLVATVGSILFVFLMPFRCCCSQDGCYAAMLSFIFNCLIMCPCHAWHWASGAGDKEPVEQEPGTKSSYGGTLKTELGECSE